MDVCLFDLCVSLFFILVHNLAVKVLLGASFIKFHHEDILFSPTVRSVRYDPVKHGDVSSYYNDTLSPDVLQYGAYRPDENAPIVSNAQIEQEKIYPPTCRYERRRNTVATASDSPVMYCCLRTRTRPY